MQSSELNALHPKPTTSKIPNNTVMLQHQIQFPTPTSAWNLNSMPWTLATNTELPGGVMQFSALGQKSRRRTQLHQKRKSELTVDLPPKQFISEEKITAHFNGLHISSDYIQNTPSSPTSLYGSGGIGDDDDDDAPSTSGKCFTNLTYQDYKVTAQELSEKLKRASRITMCEEIRKLNEEQRQVSYLPEALLNRVERPCTALVLWQPPPILELLKDRGDATNGEQEKRHSPKSLNYFEDEYDNADTGDIDDFIDNNNTCSLDFNEMRADGMDEMDL